MFSRFVNRRAALGGLSLSAVLALAPRWAAAQAPTVEDVLSEPFSIDLLREKARRLAAAPFAKPAAPPPPATVPEQLRFPEASTEQPVEPEPPPRSTVPVESICSLLVDVSYVSVPSSEVDVPTWIVPGPV